MNREDIIRMAREADLWEFLEIRALLPELQRFAELVAAHALIEPCCGNYAQCQKVCMPRAAAAEREACAQVCEEKQQYAMPIPCPDGIDGCSVMHCVPARREKTGQECAEAIRARGNKT